MKYVIIGAVAGGASTAARLRRMDEHATIVLFDRGPHISYANCGLPYYIGGVIRDRGKLFVQTPESFRARFNIDVRVLTEITAIDPLRKTVTARALEDGTTCEETYDKLVLSPGAVPIRPPLPGIDLPGIFTLRNVADTDRIREQAMKHAGGHAVIIGAGFIGLEMAENLRKLGLQVSVVEMTGQVMAPVDFPVAAIAQQHMRSKGIDLRLRAAVTGFEQAGTALGVHLEDGTTLPADVVILSIGVRPDTRLASMAGLRLGPSGGIWVNEFLQTSQPDIYAVGDAIEFAHPLTGQSMPTYLAGPANKQGRICATNIALGNHLTYKGAIQTAIVQLFGMTVATTGLASKHLSRAGIEHLVSTIHGGSHAGYYPGSQLMTIQITFSPRDGRLYGAQVAGFGGVDKRIDVFSSVIRQQGTIYDLSEFEQAYAPPYSSAKDPVNMAGFVAENILRGHLKICHWNDLDSAPGNHLLIDVRSPEEFADGSIAGAVNIPADQVRERMAELPRDRPIYLYCQQGLRGYIVHRILRHNGFEQLYNLSGGYALWKPCQAEKQLLEKREPQPAG